MLLVMNGQRNRTDTAVLVQWPGHTMDGEHTSSDRQFCLVGSVFCNLFSLWRIFPSGRWVSQWCCTWFCYLCVFDVAILRKQGSEGQVCGKALAMFGLWQLKCVLSHESSCQLLPWAVWHWQELKLLWTLVFSLFGTTEDEIVCELCYETIVARFVRRPAL